MFNQIGIAGGQETGAEGGVAIFIALLTAYGLLMALHLNGGGVVLSGLPFALQLLPAIAVIFATGLVDDIVGIRPWQKLTGQLVAALLAWGGGIHMGGIANHSFHPATSFVVTLIWIVACTNAVNLIDGIDGLATGVGLFATVTILIAALLSHNIELALATVPLAGALLGFLRFNFNPASIFLGDCGSLTIGFLLGCYGVVWSEKSTTLLGMTAPLLALSVPLFDAGLAIVRRFLRQQPIFGADRGHIHHKLLSRGLTPRRVALVLYGMCGLAAAASLLLTVSQEHYRGFVIILVCLATWLGLQHLGYNEFGAARKLIVDGAFRGLLNAQMSLSAFEQELETCATLVQAWDLLLRSHTQFGFAAIELHLDGIVESTGHSGGWHVRIDFPGHGYINLTRALEATNRGAVAVPFIDCTARVLTAKLNQFEPGRDRLAMTAYAD